MALFESSHGRAFHNADVPIQRSATFRYSATPFEPGMPRWAPLVGCRRNGKLRVTLKGMPQSTPDPKLVEAAIARVRAGSSLAEVAQSIGVGKSTVHRWVRAAEAAATPKSVAIAAAVSVLGDDWTIAGAAELAEVQQDAVHIWLRARVDALLARKGLPPEAVPSGLEFSGLQF